MPESRNNVGIKKVLVVEDEPRVRRYSCRVFNSLGYHVLEAENARQAMDMLMDDHNDIHLVFSDIIMPGDNNGRDLAEHVQANYPHIEVMLTSGFEKTLAGEAQDKDNHFPVLKKPYSKKELESALEKL